MTGFTRLGCPWCDVTIVSPVEQLARRARVRHLYDVHDPPLSWASKLEEFDNA